MFRTTLFALCGALLAHAPVFAAPPRDIDAQVARAMRVFEVPGMAVTIVEGGTTTHAKGYGIRRLGRPGRVDERTTFPIGSNTKAFTAAALAILADEGKLGWDDRVIDRLPGFRMYDAYATGEMTIRDLLVHRSGLGLGAGDLLFWPNTDFTRQEIVERLRYIKPATSFRSSYAYDNVLYIVAGRLIEEVSGRPWEIFVRERLLAPLGMNDSFPSRVAVTSENRGWPHARLDGPVRGVGTQQPCATVEPRDAAVPAGGIQASARDMARWLQVQLDRGQMNGGRRLFSEKAAEEMWKPHTVIPTQAAPAPLALTTPNFATYGLGWNIRDYRGHRIVTHTGSVEGGLSVTALIPEKNVGFAVMFNSEDDGARRALFYLLLDHYLRLPSPDWIANYAQLREQEVAEALQVLKEQTGDSASGAELAAHTGPSLPMSRYSGVYRDAWYGTVTIDADAAGALRIRFDRSPGMSGALEHVRHDTFRTRFTDRRIEDAYLTFSLSPEGSIEQMKMRAVSPLADFSFDYQDLLFVPQPGTGGSPAPGR